MARGKKMRQKIIRKIKGQSRLTVMDPKQRDLVSVTRWVSGKTMEMY